MVADGEEGAGLDTIPERLGQRNRPLASLAPDDFEILAPHLTRIEMPQGMVVADVEAPIKHVYFPENGMVSFVMVTHSGHSVEAATIGREGIVGSVSLLGTGVSMVHSMVQIPGFALRMEAARFKAAVEQNLRIRHMVDRCAEGMLGHTLQSVACMAFHTVEARLARWLLTARDEIGSDTIRLTQEFLAQMLGCQRTTVTLITHTLQTAGMIRHSRGRIEIVDPEALKASSCECYVQTKQRIEHIFPTRP
jgi:CRP-like cAMP-binding protein